MQQTAHTHRGGEGEGEPSDVDRVLLLKSKGTHSIGYCVTGMMEVCVYVRVCKE